MLQLPDKIKTTLEELRREYKFFVSLKRINEKYYLYRQTTVWNKEKKKLKVISNYLGRITEDGAFIRKEVTRQDELENAKAIIQAYGGKVLLPKTEDEEGVKVNELVPDEVDRKILMTLSMNSRASLTFLSKQIGFSVSATYNRVKHLEKKYGIEYIAEINAEKLGYREFLITVKFSDQLPYFEELKESFLKEPLIQFAITTKGDYDLLFYALAKTTDELAELLSRIRTGALSKYKSLWTSAAIAKSFGCIPLREEFIVLMEKDLLKREFAVLKELNKNGVIEFAKIDKIYGFDEGRAQYTYHKLLEKGILERTTISMQNINVKYLGIILMAEIDTEKFEQNRMKFLTRTIQSVGIMKDKFIYRANILTPEGILCLLPVNKDGQLEQEIKESADLDIGINITANISTGIIMGSICSRLFDMAYSLQQAALIRDYKMKEAPKVNYFETGRSKSRRS